MLHKYSLVGNLHWFLTHGVQYNADAHFTYLMAGLQHVAQIQFGGKSSLIFNSWRSIQCWCPLPISNDWVAPCHFVFQNVFKGACFLSWSSYYFRKFASNFTFKLVNSMFKTSQIHIWFMENSAGTWLTLHQVMVCCLMAPSHYLIQFGLIINKLARKHRNEFTIILLALTTTKYIWKLFILKWKSVIPWP